MKHTLLTILTILPALSKAACLTTADISELKSCPSIKLMVGVTAGGASDIFARELSIYLKKANSDLNIVVDNKPGASGNIAAAEMVSKNDPCTLMVGTAASISINSLNPDLKPQIDPMKDYEHVALIAKNPLILITNVEKTKVSSAADFMKKLATGNLSYSSPGIGSTNHLTAYMLETLLGIENHSVHAPSKGAAAASLLLQSGDIDFLFDNPTTASTLLQNKNMLPLGTTSNSPFTIDGREIPPLSKIPGLAKFSAESWFGLVANKSITATGKSAWANAVRCMKTDVEFAKKYSQMGFELPAISGEGFKKLASDEIKHWAPIFKQATFSK
jgi:tripartite-type tricarboxylate transporter receptor subunit TctC